MSSFSKRIFHRLILKCSLLFLYNLALGQKSWDKATFALTCKESEKKWNSLTLDGKIFGYCFLNKSYQDTNPDGTHNFWGTVLLDIDKNDIDSLTGIKICTLISKTIKLNSFIVFRTCKAYKIYISSTGPKNQAEKRYLIENHFGTYTGN